MGEAKAQATVPVPAPVWGLEDIDYSHLGPVCTERGRLAFNSLRFCTDITTAEKETVDLVRVLACGRVVESFGEFVTAALCRPKTSEEEIKVSAVSGEIYFVIAK
ncbi:hypothetical protein WN944_006516 [Citrus x changshan-huyou]|uniref:Uncharacterized protein n=1 Tax=Citrus x changshan-huyou TaxID=2935761 RepID=A0AAP0MLT6_9ROSI